MILALLLTLKATISQGDDCVCSPSSPLPTTTGTTSFGPSGCYDRGCIRGTNIHCNNGSFDIDPSGSGVTRGGAQLCGAPPSRTVALPSALAEF